MFCHLCEQLLTIVSIDYIDCSQPLFFKRKLEIASETRVGEKRDIPVQFARSWNKNTRKREAANSLTSANEKVKLP